MRTVAILGGGDWYDASVDHIQVPNDMNMNKMNQEYTKKYGYLARQESGIEYMSFIDWLLERGCKIDDSVEEFYDD